MTNDTAPTLDEIRRAAQHLANRHNDTAACAALLNAEIKAAIGPVLERFQTTLDMYAAAEATAEADLRRLLERAPQLFMKPRTVEVDGVRCGFKREPDGLTWADDEAVIARIEALRPDLAPVLIRNQKSLIVDALAGLEKVDLVALGIRIVAGADQVVLTVRDNDVEKLAKAILSDAARRQGDDEAAPKAKARAKRAAGVAA